MNLKSKPFEYFQKPIPREFWQILIISPAILFVALVLDFNYLHFIGVGLFLWANETLLPKLINELIWFKEIIHHLLKLINPINIWNFFTWMVWEGEGEKKKEKREKRKFEESVRAYEKAEWEKAKKQWEERLEQEEAKEEERIRQEKIREENERNKREKTGQQEKRQQKPKDKGPTNWWEGKDKNSLKREWKRLAKIYHPDNGTSADPAVMKRINAEYDYARKYL